MAVRFNLNDHIRVKLTAKGRRMLVEYCGKGASPMPNQDRWHTFSVWQFAHIFGPGLVMGMEEPVEMEAEFA